MKKSLLLLFFIMLSAKGFTQQLPVYYIPIEKSEFKVVTGMCLIGVGLGYQTYFYRGSYRPFYHYPEVTIPVTLGLSLTITGIIDGIKKEKKSRETIKN